MKNCLYYLVLLLTTAILAGCNVSADNYILKPTASGGFQPSHVRPVTINLDNSDQVYIRLFNGDDIQTVWINDIEALKIHDSANSGWVDITERLTLDSNTLTYSLENTMTLVSYGFQLKVNDRFAINRVGGAAKGGHRDGGIYHNAALPVGEVMRMTVTLRRAGGAAAPVAPQPIMSTVPQATSTVRVVPNTGEQITFFGQGAGVHQPHVADVNGRLRLFYGYRYGHPGEAGIGYIDLNDEGLAVSQEKHRLANRDGYYMIHTPYYHDETIYTTSYYIWRAGEWAMYLTSAPTRIDDDNAVALDIDELISQPVALDVRSHGGFREQWRGDEDRAILTASDRDDGHWMGRNVEYPVPVEIDGTLRLFFLAGSWYTHNAQPSLTSLGYMDKTRNGWSEPQQLCFPTTASGELPSHNRGYRVTSADGDAFLLWYMENDHNTGRTELKLYHFIDNQLHCGQTVVDQASLIAQLDLTPETKIGQGIEIANIDGKDYLYFVVKDNIYRVELEFEGVL